LEVLVVQDVITMLGVVLSYINTDL
jgi:hypothetical protein